MFFAGLSVALGCAACRSLPPVQRTPLALGDARVEQAFAAWRAETGARRALRAQMRLRIEGRDGTRIAEGRQRLVIERPERLRVEILGLLGQGLGLLVVDAGRYEVFRAADRRVERGALHPALLLEQAGLELETREAIDLLLGAPAVAESTPLRAAWGDERGGLVFELGPDAEGAVYELVLAADRRPLRLARRSAFGDGYWSADWSDPAQSPQGVYARRLELSFARSGTRAEVEFDAVEWNPQTHDDWFRLPPGLGAQP